MTRKDAIALLNDAPVFGDERAIEASNYIRRLWTAKDLYWIRLERRTSKTSKGALDFACRMYGEDLREDLEELIEQDRQQALRPPAQSEDLWSQKVTNG